MRCSVRSNRSGRSEPVPTSWRSEPTSRPIDSNHNANSWTSVDSERCPQRTAASIVTTKSVTWCASMGTNRSAAGPIEAASRRKISSTRPASSSRSPLSSFHVSTSPRLHRACLAPRGTHRSTRSWRVQGHACWIPRTRHSVLSQPLSPQTQELGQFDEFGVGLSHDATPQVELEARARSSASQAGFRIASGSLGPRNRRAGRGAALTPGR